MQLSLQSSSNNFDDLEKYGYKKENPEKIDPNLSKKQEQKEVKRTNTKM